MTEHEPIKIGEFEVIRQLGAGAMGIVYLAKQTTPDRLVAIKVLGNSMASPRGKVRFAREANAVAKLKHPNIATVYYVGQDEHFCFMAMEYIDGISLRAAGKQLLHARDANSSFERAAKSESEVAQSPQSVRFDQDTIDFNPDEEETGPSPNVDKIIQSEEHIRWCCDCVKKLAAALHHAHEHNVIHRDVKPENIMINRDSEPFLIDFGIAKFLEDETITQTGQLIGTPLYMSPEQVASRIELDHRSDIYSLGIVFYELLTLLCPIDADTREGVFRAIVNKQIEPVRWHNKKVSADLESIVHKATAKDPDDRYEAASTLANDIDLVLDGKAVTATPYKYKHDEAEIQAQRPIRLLLIYAMWLFLVLPALGVGLLLPLNISRGMFTRMSWSLTRVAETTTTALCCLFIVLLPFAIYGTYRGRHWGWLLAVIIGVLLVIVPVTISPKAAFQNVNDFSWGLVIVIAIVLCTAIVVCDRPRIPVAFAADSPILKVVIGLTLCVIVLSSVGVHLPSQDYTTNLVKTLLLGSPLILGSISLVLLVSIPTRAWFKFAHSIRAARRSRMATS